MTRSTRRLQPTYPPWGSTHPPLLLGVVEGWSHTVCAVGLQARGGDSGIAPPSILLEDNVGRPTCLHQRGAPFTRVALPLPWWQRLHLGSGPCVTRVALLYSRGAHGTKRARCRPSAPGGVLPERMWPADQYVVTATTLDFKPSYHQCYTAQAHLRGLVWHKDEHGGNSVSLAHGNALHGHNTARITLA